MARGRQSKRATRRQNAKGQIGASQQARLATAAATKGSFAAKPASEVRSVNADSLWPLMPTPSAQRKPRVGTGTPQRSRSPSPARKSAPLTPIAARAKGLGATTAETNANARVALLLALPLLVMALAMLDRSGALKTVWPARSVSTTEIASRKLSAARPTLEAPLATREPVATPPAKRVAGPIQSRTAATDIAATSRATPLPPLLPPVASRLPTSQSLAGPSTRLDQVAQNRSLMRKTSQSPMSGAEAVHATETVAVATPPPATPRLALPAPLAPATAGPPLALPPMPSATAMLNAPPIVAPRSRQIEVPAPLAHLPATPPEITPAPKSEPVVAALRTNPVLPPAPPAVATPTAPPAITALPPAIEPEVPPPAVVAPSLVVARPKVRPDALIDNSVFGPLVAVALPRLGDATEFAPPQALAPMPTFGEKLAAAAFEQTKKDVTYDPRYVRISYPMGDVPDHMGVCTDVVVRAYRTLGIDLQELVQKTRSGTGDTNIDHRRVLVLRKFFEQHGRSLPVSAFPEDYKPGDLVTYFKPHGRTSKFHIVVVSDRLTPDGRPLVIHNRGYGAKLEDALFKERITGHYRFDGLAQELIAAKKPAPLKLHRAAIHSN